MGLGIKPRKRKIPSDPRNNSWANNENGYGYRMLRKMGWVKGDNLGQNQVVSTSSSIGSNKLKFGVGYKDNNEVKLIEDYERILSRLNRVNED
jgi:hypothetical protein